MSGTNSNNSVSSNTLSLPNLNHTMAGLGFRPVDPFGLLNSVTKSFGVLIQQIFAWVYFLSEIAILLGVVVYLLGAIGHHNQIKRTGAHMVLYAIFGFCAAVILPGIIVAINTHFHTT